MGLNGCTTLYGLIMTGGWKGEADCSSSSISSCKESMSATCSANCFFISVIACSFSHDDLAKIWTPVEVSRLRPPFNCGDTPQDKFLHNFDRHFRRHLNLAHSVPPEVDLEKSRGHVILTIEIFDSVDSVENKINLSCCSVRNRAEWGQAGRRSGRA